MTERITPEILKSLFIEIIQKNDQFIFLEGIQPFLISFKGDLFYIYIKNLSSAYFEDRPDTTRAQLPIRAEFEKIKNSSIPFVFLGYDIENDVYVCWNYHIVKARLNEKESVSFYSRKSFQKEVKTGILLRKKLKNDDNPVLFKRTDLLTFFEKIDTLFDNKNKQVENNMKEEKKSYEKDGKLYKITEEELLNKIYLVFNEDSMNILEGISIAKEYYGDKYPNMKYSDWSNLVKSTKSHTTKNKSSIDDLLSNPDFKILLGEMPDRSVAEKFNCSSYDVYLARKTLGIKKFGRMENCKTPKDIDEILLDYEKLGSLQKVAEKYGCTKQALSLRLKNESIELQKGRKRKIISLNEDLAFEYNKKYATTIMNYLFNNNLITDELLNLLCDKNYMDKELGTSIPFPILLQIDETQSLKEQVFISGQNRYYTDQIYEYKGKKYVISSQWYGPGTTKTDTKTPFIKFIKKYLPN